MDQFESLNHTKWDCEYHVVFIPKYRRRTLYGDLKRHLGPVFRQLAEQRESRVEEGHLMMPGERKSVEPIASVVAPSRVSAEHQSLLHLVGQSAWSDESLLAKVRELVVPAMETQGRIEALDCR